MSENEFNSLKNTDVKDCNIDELVDITNIDIQENLSKEEKIIEYLKKVKNPYLFKVGDVAVKIGFSSEEYSIEDKMQNVIDNILQKEVG